MMILDPVGRAETMTQALAPRPSSLDGVVVGLLDNSKPNAQVLLARVADELKARFGARDIRIFRKPGASVAASAAVIEEIASSCQVALTGSAD